MELAISWMKVTIGVMTDGSAHRQSVLTVLGQFI